MTWNIRWVNLDICACNKMLVWAADKHSHSIMNNNWKPLKTLFSQCYQHFDYLIILQYVLNICNTFMQHPLLYICTIEIYSNSGCYNKNNLCRSTRYLPVLWHNYKWVHIATNACLCLHYSGDSIVWLGIQFYTFIIAKAC